MSDNIETHLKKVIKYLTTQVREGTGTNRANLDGYTLAGLEKKKQILEECLNKLNNR
jgi:hypothetical protein